MVLMMPRPWKHPKTGVFWLRRRVPDALRDLVGKSEELRSLDTKDIEDAKRRFPLALAELEERWANLRSGLRDLSEREAHDLAARVHDNWLRLYSENPSEQFIWHPAWVDRLWTEVDPMGALEGAMPEAITVDSLIVTNMRRFCFKQADLCIADQGLVIDQWSRLRLAKAIGAALQRASLTLEAVVTGQLDPAAFFTRLGGGRNGETNGQAVLVAEQPRIAAASPGDGIALTSILERWWQEAKAAGRKPSTFESYGNTVRAFTTFLGHDDAARVSARDVVAFKDHRLSTPSAKTGKVPSAKTVKDSDLSALKTIFGWGVSNHLLPNNPATAITIRLAKPARLRSKGFTEAEAQAILSAALHYKPRNELPTTAAAKRWVPWLCAFTGARVGEIAQLRKQDLRRHENFWVIRITPEAGTVKSNTARDVVLHDQLIEQGFADFVAGAPEGHLFIRPGPSGDVLGPLQSLKNRLAEFSRSIIDDPNVAPNHGWRHRFKTVGLEAGISQRILDAIQGHAARSVGDAYGDVTLATIAAAMGSVACRDTLYHAKVACRVWSQLGFLGPSKPFI